MIWMKVHGDDFQIGNTIRGREFTVHAHSFWAVWWRYFWMRREILKNTI